MDWPDFWIVLVLILQAWTLIVVLGSSQCQPESAPWSDWSDEDWSGEEWDWSDEEWDKWMSSCQCCDKQMFRNRY